MARFHNIFFDNTICHVATLLKMGVTQIVLAMIEQEHVDPRLILDGPLDALQTWSRDPDCKAVARMITGRQYSAVEVQQEFWDRAKAFVDDGRAEGIVPRAAEILDIWGRTLAELRAWDVEALMGKLDHVLKRCILEQVMADRGLAWDSSEIRYLDQIYSSLRPSNGLYRLYEKDVAEKVVTDGQIERFVYEPPADTRAYLRGQIVRHVDPDSLTSMDWDSVRLRFSDETSQSRWPVRTRFVLSMANPLAFTKARCGGVLDSGEPVRRALARVGMVESTWLGRPVKNTDTASPGAAATTSDGGQIVLLRDVSRVGLYDNTSKSRKGGEN